MSVGRTRVLVADDNETYGALLSRFVSSEHDMVVVGLASDGDEAVAMTSLLRPEVVLMDLCMPGTDGFDAIRALARDRRKYKIIALTARRSNDFESLSLELGACAFILKADVDSLLLDVIRGIAASH